MIVLTQSAVEAAVTRLRAIDARWVEDGDTEEAHVAADQVLLDLINSADVTIAWECIEKGYA